MSIKGNLPFSCVQTRVSSLPRPQSPPPAPPADPVVIGGGGGGVGRRSSEVLEVSVRRVTSPLQEFEAARQAAVDRIRREEGVGVSRGNILFKGKN